ncbi:ABC transporter permease [Paenibacillus shirakamiensis]|uniref:ABC transporter permease n=1 Tax=Paenibacillus shirakamiensis TaxID=1265935 RepID=UPI001AE0ED0C
MPFKPWLKLYMILIRSSLQSRMQYKFNFILSTMLAAMIQIAEFLMVALVLYKFGAIRGWTVYELGYLFAIMTLSKTIYRSLASDVHHLENYLVEGQLDQLLTRPVPVLFALMTQNFRLMLGEILQGSFLLIWSMRHMMNSGQLHAMSIPYTLLMILSGATILFAIGLATASAGFWTTRIQELQTLTEDAAQTAAKYPLHIYPSWLKSFFLFVVPVGFVNYVPSLFILHGEYGLWLLLITVGVSLLLLILSLQFWSYGLSKYQSTGS